MNTESTLERDLRRYFKLPTQVPIAKPKIYRKYVKPSFNYTRTCLFCKVDFTPHSASHVYCTRKCYRKKVYVGDRLKQNIRYKVFFAVKTGK